MRHISVKYFHFDFSGAPTLNGIAGSLIAVLDACLVNGFNVRPVSSFAVVGGVGTINFPTAGHGFGKHQVVQISGANDDACNGDYRVTAVTSTSITVDATGVADGVVASSGGLAAKIAPAGWQKAFSDVNLGAYKSAAADATGMLLRVDDTVGQVARVRGFESMTDINTGVGKFPSDAQRTYSVWGKSGAASAASRQWTVIADDRLFYIIVHTEWDSLTSYPNNRVGYVFGDFVPYKTADAYCAILTASNIESMSSLHNDSSGNSLHRGNDPGDGGRGYMARSFSQVGGAVQQAFCAIGNYAGQSVGVAYPNPGDNSLLIDKTKLVIEVATSAARGEMPGFWTFINSRPATHGVLLDTAVPGRVLFVVGTCYAYNGEYSTRWAVDITGPWR